MIVPPVFYMVFGTLYSIIRSLFVRVRQADLTNVLHVDKHPRLARVLYEVSRDVGTRQADVIVLETDTTIAVTEVGGIWRTLTGRPSQRVLMIGIGLLPALTVGELRSILAHEFAHFMNRDTAGGVFVHRLSASLSRAVATMIETRAARWFNPAWWFLNAFLWIFGVMSRGASRLHEVLADRRAAFTYGSTMFAASMNKVIRGGVEFSLANDMATKRVVYLREIPANYFKSLGDDPRDTGAIDAKTKELVTRPAGRFDTHPATSDCLAWVAALNAPSTRVRPGDADAAWSLFADRTAIEEALSERLRYRIAAEAKYDIQLAGETSRDVGAGVLRASHRPRGR